MNLQEMNELKKDLEQLEKIYTDLKHFNKPFVYTNRDNYGAPRGVYFGFKKLFPFLGFIVNIESISTKQEAIFREVHIKPTDFKTPRIIKQIAKLRADTLNLLAREIDIIYENEIKSNKKVIKLFNEGTK